VVLLHRNVLEMCNFITSVYLSVCSRYLEKHWTGFFIKFLPAKVILKFSILKLFLISVQQ